ncbi:VanZ family protein [Microbacterium sp. I2]|uniref:VanZ family protein n=1 Tax=Microbacterium sp. I2 TaxID=3391826 RepID=UPI003ED9A621
MRERSTVRRPWVIVGLALYAVAVAGVLLLPVSYSGIVNGIGDWLRYDLGIMSFGSGWIEFGANILMFVPLGFLLTLLFRRPWIGVALAVGASVAAELAQFVIPSREPASRDIIANTAGALLGAALAWLVIRARSRGAAHDSASGAPPTETTRAR